MALTAAEVARSILDAMHVTTDKVDLVIITNKLEQWAAQLQPQPDESDEAFATIVAELARDMRQQPYEDLAIALEPLIARHTAAKVAAAEERGWNRGAATMRAAAFQCAQDYALESWRHGYVDSSTPHNALKQGAREVATSIHVLTLPTYKKEGK